MLEVESLEVHSGELQLLGPITFRVCEGRPLVIMGETGAGKSLIAQSIMGALPSPLETRGEISLNGQRVDPLPPSARQALWGHTISILPQEPWRALAPIMPAFGQVKETYSRVAGLARHEAHKATDGVYGLLGLRGSEKQRTDQLSGGMGQRVAFAAATAGGARVLLADEPTKGLDRARAQTTLQRLLDIPLAGGTLVVVTHDVSVAKTIGGDLLILKDGHVVERGATEAVLANPAHEYTRSLLAADPGRWHRPQFDGRPTATPVLEAANVTVGRGASVLIKGFSLTLCGGDRVAVTGPSGCGKTSLLDTLAGLIPPLDGVVRRGADVGKTGIQKIYQTPAAAFPPQVSIVANLLDVARLHGISWESIASLLARMSVDLELLERRPDAVSGGELQRISIARALAVRPDLLLADEPTSRLDPITQKETLDLLATVAAQTNVAVVLVTHDEALAYAWAHKTTAVGGEQAA
ncbi:MAG: ATP-binding cassette domain-containing protein [Gammaproteobacteria bacterium]|nr:ATP-binding cassette domain-containing protein [Gammaproteobacteria bacterium]